jgi:hypothetical protein
MFLYRFHSELLKRILRLMLFKTWVLSTLQLGIDISPIRHYECLTH